jgi:hypothetical protein
MEMVTPFPHDTFLCHADASSHEYRHHGPYIGAQYGAKTIKRKGGG